MSILIGHVINLFELYTFLIHLDHVKRHFLPTFSTTSRE